ncbi:MAG: hypothetical protein HUJ95_04090, partial [Bacteroidales bacterium]|nr:hypothetical protein [Bacteroidales bacterium]
MKKRFLFLLSIALVLGMSCKPEANIPTPKPDPTPTPTPTPDPDPDPDPEPEVFGNKVLFLGNSLTYYGEVIVDVSGSPTQTEGVFAKIAKADGRSDIKVTNFCYGSAGYFDGRSKASADGLPSTMSNYGIYQLLTNLYPNYYGKGTTMDSIYDQDYVVLQQRGSNVAQTYQHAKNIMSLFPPTVKFFVMTTHYDYIHSNVMSANDKLNQNDGVEIIPWGQLVTNVWNNQIYGMGYKYKKSDFIITKDNQHPNYLTGYIEALMTYCLIFKTSAVGKPYNFVKKTFGSYYTDQSETQFNIVLSDAEEMRKIQILIDGYLAGKSISELHFSDVPVSKEDNVLKGLTVAADAHFGPSAWSQATLSAMTDGIKAYGNGANYTDTKWEASATAAKSPSKHYDITGKETSSGKYLCGFTMDLGQTVTVDSLAYYNQRTLMDIDGFDVAVSKDGSSWTVVYSGEKLASGCK